MTIERLSLLLANTPEALERMLHDEPGNEDLSLALTVKEFMADFGIEDPREGIPHFLAFRDRQSRAIGQAQLPSIPLV